MEMRILGNSGLKISRLGLGTMTWGRDTDEHEAAEQLKAYVDAGGNFIDTAAIYGDGDSERVIGGFLNTLVSRDEIVIATKAGITFNNGEKSINNSRSSLMTELDRSIARLGATRRRESRGVAALVGSATMSGIGAVPGPAPTTGRRCPPSTCPT